MSRQSQKEADRSAASKRNPISFDKLPPNIQNILDNKLPKEMKAALLAGCHEFDFMSCAHLLMQMSQQNVMGLPPANMQITSAHRAIGAAMIRMREAMIHMSDFNASMEEVREMIEEMEKEEGIHAGGIVTATPDQAERLAEQSRRILDT